MTVVISGSSHIKVLPWEHVFLLISCQMGENDDNHVTNATCRTARETKAGHLKTRSHAETQPDHSLARTHHEVHGAGYMCMVYGAGYSGMGNCAPEKVQVRPASGQGIVQQPLYSNWTRESTGASSSRWKQYPACASYLQQPLLSSWTRHSDSHVSACSWLDGGYRRSYHSI